MAAGFALYHRNSFPFDLLSENYYQFTRHDPKIKPPA
jgi:hypothetical protein